MFLLEPGERLDDLVRDGLKIIQKPGAFCFSMDAVLLANFATVKKGDMAADLGTGTGVVPLLLTTRKKARRIYGLEIQQDAVNRASRSVSGNGLADQIEIINGDIKEAVNLLGSGRFDLITSNPPYMPTGRGEINPVSELALARHEISCTLADVISAGAGLLNSLGRMAVVHRPERLADLLYLMKSCGLEPKRLRTVYPKPGRKPSMVLVEAMKGAKPDLSIMAPLFVYDSEGKYTPELMEIYYPGMNFGKAEA
ncbi:tRNA1(Val) (adenine(37)-N6)-methyltransferase [bacterium]|nr:MAG: tRNA1(Val) (adenine(37)-N6)-methyltransferase [bacterium]